MAFSTDNIGKNCYINMSEDENVEDSLYGTIIGYYEDTDKNEEYYFVSINGNVIKIYDDSLVSIIEDGEGSGAVSSVNGKTGAVVLNAEDVRASPAETVVEVSGTTLTITSAANTIYKCGELTSLTISNPPASGAYSIVFTSGTTATETTFPASILGLENFAAEANTLYEINVLDNRAVVGKWAVST